MTVPDWLDGLLHPRVCVSWCFDFRGLAFYVTAIFPGPVVVSLSLLAWRWRGPRRWPLAVVLLIDAAAIWLVAVVVIGFLHTRSDTIPTVASGPPLLLPALATLALGSNLIWPLPWKPILALSAAGCLLWLNLAYPSCGYFV